MFNPMLNPFIALLLAILGFAWIALAMAAHWRQVWGSRPLSARSKMTLRTAGGLALLLSLICVLTGESLAMSVILWFMLLAAATLIVSLALNRRPSWLTSVCFIC